MDDLLTAAALNAFSAFPDPTGSAQPAGMLGDRSHLKVNFLEPDQNVGRANVELQSAVKINVVDERRANLSIMLGAMLGCTVSTTNMEYGQHTFKQYFDWSLLTEALRAHGARFSTEIYTQGCHWFPHLLA
jgi:hypothetical protein